MQGGAGTSGIQPGREASAEGRVLAGRWCKHELGAEIEGRRIPVGAIGFAGVKQREEGLSAWCLTAEFTASGCLGNVSGFKKQLNMLRMGIGTADDTAFGKH